LNHDLSILRYVAAIDTRPGDQARDGHC
jgi:hypothetical protein